MRYEYKYFVPIQKLDELRRMIQPFVDLDSYGEGKHENSYTVRSIYFDSARLRDYHDKVAGIKHRKKVRLRGYDSGGEMNTTFLEIKRKYEIPIKKFRCPLPYRSAKELLFENGNLEELVQKAGNNAEQLANAQRFCYQIHTGQLVPTVLVTYEREAYLGKMDTDIRITFDKYLRSTAFPSIDGLFEEKGAKTCLKNVFILEVKFNQYFPAWMKPIIGALRLNLQSASKYVISMDTHSMRTNSPTRIHSLSKWKSTPEEKAANGISSSQTENQLIPIRKESYVKPNTVQKPNSH